MNFSKYLWIKSNKNVYFLKMMEILVCSITLYAPKMQNFCNDDSHKICEISIKIYH